MKQDGFGNQTSLCSHRLWHELYPVIFCVASLVGISGRNLLQGLEQSGFLTTTVKPKIIQPNAATHLTTEVLKIILEFIIEQPSLLSRAALHNHSVMSFCMYMKITIQSSVVLLFILNSVFKCFAKSFILEQGTYILFIVPTGKPYLVWHNQPTDF